MDYGSEMSMRGVTDTVCEIRLLYFLFEAFVRFGDVGDVTDVDEVRL